MTQKHHISPLLRFIRSLSAGRMAADDGVLLDRYISQRDEAAFELLLWRHAALVLGLCLEILGETPDAEDAFQAVFLVLARKARSIRKPASLAGWLHQVAVRVALRARKARARRIAREEIGANGRLEQFPAPDAPGAPPWRPIMHEEIARLPAKYQLPVVLCYLEGKTHDQAAVELGWPKGTVSGRLARARNLLHRRLVRRGLDLSTASSFIPLMPPVTANVSAALAGSVAKTAVSFATGTTAGISPQVALWAEGAIRAMLLTKAKSLTFAFIAVVLLGTTIGAGGLAMRGSVPSGGGPGAVQPAVAHENMQARQGGNSDAKSFVAVSVFSQRDGTVAFVGSEIRDGEKVPAQRLITVSAGTEIQKSNDKENTTKKTLRFKALRLGDEVKAGKLLMQLDDRLARNDLAMAEAKLTLAREEEAGASLTAQEFKQRFEAAQKLWKREPPLIAQEEFREKKLGYEKYRTEAEGHKAKVRLAELDVEKARIILDMYQIRSPVDGVVRRILKRKGEPVKALERVMEIASSKDQ